MRHLKRFDKAFDIETLNDILLELKDDGFSVGISGLSSPPFIYIHKDDKSDMIFYWDEIKDCVLRIIDFLGDDFVEFNYITNDFINNGYKVNRVKNIDSQYENEDDIYGVNIVFDKA